MVANSDDKFRKINCYLDSIKYVFDENGTEIERNSAALRKLEKESNSLVKQTRNTITNALALLEIKMNAKIDEVQSSIKKIKNRIDTLYNEKKIELMAI